MHEVYYEGSRAFMRGRRKRKRQSELSELQRRILDKLSDGELHGMTALARELEVSFDDCKWSVDVLSLEWPLYEESRGRRCSIGILTEACFE